MHFWNLELVRGNRNKQLNIVIKSIEEITFKMFELDIESEFRAISFYDSEQQIRFDPPVYEQRYSAVIRILELERWTKYLKKVSKNKFQFQSQKTYYFLKVVEFGCAEMRMLFQMKTIPSIQHIVEVSNS